MEVPTDTAADVFLLTASAAATTTSGTLGAAAGGGVGVAPVDNLRAGVGAGAGAGGAATGAAGMDTGYLIQQVARQYDWLDPKLLFPQAGQAGRSPENAMQFNDFQKRQNSMIPQSPLASGIQMQ